MNQDWWGIEYLDDGLYGKLSDNKSEVKKVSNVYLSTEFLYEIADKRYLSEISIRDRNVIDGLADSISKIGFLEPAWILVDKSKIRLKDGNHRLLASIKLGIKEMPVEISETQNLTGGSSNILDIIIPLLEGKWQVQN